MTRVFTSIFSFSYIVMVIRWLSVFYLSIFFSCFSVASGKSPARCSTMRRYDSSGVLSGMHASRPINCSGVVSSDQPKPYSRPCLSTGYTKSSVTMCVPYAFEIFYKCIHKIRFLQPHTAAYSWYKDTVIIPNLQTKTQDIAHYAMILSKKRPQPSCE